MKKAMIFAALAVMIMAAACTQNKQKETTMPKNNKLVAYFSATGTTAEKAKVLAEAAKADLFEIVPEQLYTEQDLDWEDSLSRSSVEMKDKSSRPAIKNKVEDIAQYDTIYVGYPIWWYVAPTIVNTFLEQYDLEGKTIIPFFTSGGSEAGETMKYLEPSAPKANWAEPKNMNRLTDEEIKAWAEN